MPVISKMEKMITCIRTVKFPYSFIQKHYWGGEGGLITYLKFPTKIGMHQILKRLFLRKEPLIPRKNVEQKCLTNVASQDIKRISLWLLQWIAAHSWFFVVSSFYKRNFWNKISDTKNFSKSFQWMKYKVKLFL